MSVKHSPSRYPIGHPKHPNAVPRLEPAEETDRGWIRNFPRTCPYCRRDFFSWAPDPWPDNWAAWSDLASMRGGHRETCGDPDCIAAAQDEHFEFCQQERARITEWKRTQESLARAQTELDQKEAAARGF